jgi:hypothetical protein
MDTISFADLRSALIEPEAAAAFALPARHFEGDAVARGVRQALAAAQQPYRGSERRREPRLPYPYPIYLTPINPSGLALVDETLIVIGKHLSEHGVDFYHREAIPHRRVIASLDAGDLGWVGLLLELTWCRFTRHGWYDNGGRFLAVVDSPLAADC